jgi:predicted Zn finger-like uncharacterized protein
MILTCPSCGTQYVVKDGAIPPGGRQVRCASCKHSWHQHPEENIATSEPAPADEGFVEPEPPEAEEPSMEPVAEADEGESLAEATLIDPRNGPEAEERAYEEAALGEDESTTGLDSRDPTESDETSGSTYAHSQFDITKREEAAPAAESDWQEPPEPEAQEDEFAPFPAPDEVAPKRRNPVFTIALIVILIIAAAAAFWFLAPAAVKARIGLGGSGTSPLALVTTHMDRQRLESGNELLTVTGRVINPTAKEQQVPPLKAELKTKAGKVVYTWVIPPPASSLPAGASAPFNSAEVSVPPGGDELTITLGAEVG